MKCDKCGFIPNPGDQVCINCGAKLSVVNAVVPEIDNLVEEEAKKVNKKIIIYGSLGVLALIIVVFLIIKFLVLGN